MGLAAATLGRSRCLARLLQQCPSCARPPRTCRGLSRFACSSQQHNPAAAAAAEAAAAVPGGGAGDGGTAAAAAAADAAASPGVPAADPSKPLDPGLYVVGTPIGNLEDVTLRALRVLKSVTLILAEDTRHTRKLLEHYAIRTPTLSCHQFNEAQRSDQVLQRLRRGEAVALVSDAGMPAVSDPGAVMVAAAVAAGLPVVPVPGPCAAIAALAGAGLPTDAFHFAGFLPPKPGRRRAELARLGRLSATLVVYAPPHGLPSILADAAAVLGGGRRAVVARELTKLHEEFFRGSLADALAEFGPEGRRPAKGEVVLLVEGCSAADALQQQLADAAAAAAAAAGGLEREGAPVGAGAGDEGGGDEGGEGGSSGGTPAATATATAPAPASSEQLLQQLVAQQLAAGASVSGAARALSAQLQLPRSRVYRLALELEQQQQGRQGQQQRQSSRKGKEDG